MSAATQSNLLGCYLRHSDGVHDIWLARQTAHSFMRLSCKVERFSYNIRFFTVARGLIGVYKMLEGIVYHFLVSGIAHCLVVSHNRNAFRLSYSEFLSGTYVVAFYAVEAF